MNADTEVVRLPAKDSALIDHFIKVGEFKNKGVHHRHTPAKEFIENVCGLDGIDTVKGI